MSHECGALGVQRVDVGDRQCVPMAVAGVIWVLQDPARESVRGSQRNRVDGDLSLAVCVRQEGVAQSKSGLC